jgi:hypothetical protein
VKRNRTAQSAIDFGIAALTLNERTRFGSAWGRFLHFNFSGIDTNLSTLSQPERIDVLVLFAQQVRSGGVSPGKREVRAQTVQILFRAVAAKFEMDGQSNPVLRRKENIIKNSANLLRDTAETTRHQSIN